MREDIIYVTSSLIDKRLVSQNDILDTGEVTSYGLVWDDI